MSRYWKKFYRQKHILEPSSFAKFVRKFIKQRNLSVYDLGCGNGRDTYYLAKKWFTVGVDNSNRPIDYKKAVFQCCDVINFPIIHSLENLLYMRFFLHSIPDQEIEEIFSWRCRYLAIEIRSDKDIPTLYRHKRFLRSSKEIIDILHRYDYELIYFIEGIGLAKYKDEDPIIIRIIAKRKDE